MKISLDTKSFSLKFSLCDNIADTSWDESADRSGQPSRQLQPIQGIWRGPARVWGPNSGQRLRSYSTKGDIIFRVEKLTLLLQLADEK
jgi:hypothetical protein